MVRGWGGGVGGASKGREEDICSAACKMSPAAATVHIPVALHAVSCCPFVALEVMEPSSPSSSLTPFFLTHSCCHGDDRGVATPPLPGTNTLLH